MAATARFVTAPACRFTALSMRGSRWHAPATPPRASESAKGNVTLHSAYVLVRPTAPGMFATQ